MWAPLRGMISTRSFQIFSENPCKGIKKRIRMKNNNMNFILLLSITSNILTLLVTNSEYLSKFALSHII